MWGGGVPLPTGGRSEPPPQEFFLDFGSQNGDLWCILGAVFGSSAKTLMGRKDTLAQVYFYWEGGNRPFRPPGIDDTAQLSVTESLECILYFSMQINTGLNHSKRRISASWTRLLYDDVRPLGSQHVDSADIQLFIVFNNWKIIKFGNFRNC